MSITPTQRAYLALFDVHAACKTDESKAVTRGMLDQMLVPMLAESGVEIHTAGGKGHPRPDARRNGLQLLIAQLRAGR